MPRSKEAPPPPQDVERYSMPFEPYPVQREMMKTIASFLASSSPVTHVAAVEVPTGCGKTLALLSSVLGYQSALEKFTPLELEHYIHRRQWKTAAGCTTSVSSLNGDGMKMKRKRGKGRIVSEKISSADVITVDSEEKWRVPKEFFLQFRTTNSSKRLRVELDGAPGNLRRQHEPPPCSVFYITRTHSQLRQAVGELRKLHGLDRLKMNILGSRERYCIHKTVLKARANNTLPVEGNNLGEVCDKLVSLGQCDAVHNYGVLGSRAISHPLSQGRSDKIWDMEDLVTEGVATESCPYYAARDLVFFAHINFATYQYLLDPLIRHECKMEGALNNNSIIIFDEAHNVSSVCQEALSLETSLDTLHLIMREIEPLIPSSASLSTLTYPREFKLTQWTLAELFLLLYDVFNVILVFVERQECTVKESHPTQRFSTDGDNDAGSGGGGEEKRSPTISGEVLARIIHSCILEHIPLSSRGDTEDSVDMFRQVYGIVMILGVTFNPFQFSVFGLSILKRWLLVMRFMLQKPSAFVVSVYDTSAHSFTEKRRTNQSASLHRNVGIRCLDGSLAFQHLLNSTYRVVLASGTLAPFDQLGRDLGISLSQMSMYEGSHVVDSHQYRFATLTHMADGSQILCNYVNLRDPSFMDRLISVIAVLTEQVTLGGVLIFLPNYSVMRVVGSRLSSRYNTRTRAGGVKVFMEPRDAAEFSSILDAFRTATSCGRALLVSVYRAKMSEGIDFADNMTRLVICVGVPFRPLKSWTVEAQRRYNGEEWYAIDAVRAVNQALGRCLRNRHDYGAMVLLDSRCEQENFQRRLSKWCRESLKVYRTPASAVEALAEFYRSVAMLQVELEKHPPEEENTSLLSHAPTEVDQGFLLLKDGVKKHRSDVEGGFPPPSEAKAARKRGMTTCTHEWSCTAVKLLYEAHGAVEDVTAAELRDMLLLLEGEYMDSADEK